MTPDPNMAPRCQRWQDRRPSWRRPADGGFDPAAFTVEPVPAETVAAPFVERHHYSGSFPAARLAFGLLTDRPELAGPAPTEHAGQLLAGVAVLSVPMSESVLTNVFPDLAPYAESLELGRFVLVDACPANSETWFRARADQLAADVGVRGVVAFSDPVPRVREVVDLDPGTGAVTVRREQVLPGHWGCIYQAGNAVFLGRSTPRTLVWLPRQGRVLSARTLQKIRRQESGSEAAERALTQMGARPRRAGEQPGAWLAQALDEVGATRVRHPGNLRYAWPVGPRSGRRRARIALPSGPYPKPSAVVA